MLISLLALSGCAAKPEAAPSPAAETAASATDAAAPAAEPAQPSGDDEALTPTYQPEPLKLTYYNKEFNIDFTTDTLQGEAIDDSVFANAKVTMLNVWGTYCAPCLMEMPELGKLSADYADKGLQVIGLVCDVYEGKDIARDYAIELAGKTGADGYTHITVSDSVQSNIMSGVYAVPTTLFVDQNGNLICQPVVGASMYDRWAAAIDELLAGQENAA